MPKSAENVIYQGFWGYFMSGIEIAVNNLEL